MDEDELRERLIEAVVREHCDRWGVVYLPADAMFTVEIVLDAIRAAGYRIVPADRLERLRAYVVADQEFRQADTWAGIWSDDEVTRAAVSLQYAGREKRRREAHHAITLGDLDPLDPVAPGEYRTGDVETLLTANPGPGVPGEPDPIPSWEEPDCFTAGDVSVADMDRMVRYAADAPNLPAGYGGRRMLDQIDAAGLRIVRVDG